MKNLLFCILLSIFICGCDDTVDKKSQTQSDVIMHGSDFTLISTQFVQWSEVYGYRVSIIKDTKSGTEYFIVSDGYGITVTKR